MKLVFFSLALLFGVCLIHAEEVPQPGVQPSGPQSQPQPPAGEQKPIVPETASHPDSQGTKIEPKPAEHVEAHSDAQQAGLVSDTAASSSSSSPKPTTPKPTTPKPTPDPWVVIDHQTNLPCIMVSGNITLNVTLKGYEGVNATDITVLSHNIPADGFCSNKTIRWNFGSHDSSLQFQFFVNNSTKEVYLGRVDGQVYFEKEHQPVGFNNTKLNAFETPLNKSYYCGQSMKLSIVDAKDEIITVTLENFQIQAAKISTDKHFDEKIDGCPAHGGGGPDIIPIVVGCALAILVVIVLVAYLINRRRSQAHGYLSM